MKLFALVVSSWTRNSLDSEVKCKNWQSKRSLEWILTSDSESTVWNLPRKLKHIRNYRLTKKIFEFIESLWIGETRIHQKYGKPRNLQHDQGPEFSSKVKQWLILLLKPSHLVARKDNKTTKLPLHMSRKYHSRNPVSTVCRIFTCHY